MILRVDPNHNTLLHLQHVRLVRASAGKHGRGSNWTGGSAADTIVPVPPGTVIRDGGSGELLGDLVDAGQELVVATGGRGGRGNARFATPTNRAPRRADPGEEGEERVIELELKLIADLGLVGLPNAGKSTLLAATSAAHPKIADYPFTTLTPHLGVVRAPFDDLHTLVMADIPGLIEGAHAGAGLGLQFLRHVERCRALAHLVDLADPSPLADRVEVVRAELRAHSEPLDRRPWFLVGTKLDAAGEGSDAVRSLASAAEGNGVRWCAISAVSGAGLRDFLSLAFDLVSATREAE